MPFLAVAMDGRYDAVRLQTHRAARRISGEKDEFFYLDLPAQRRAATEALVRRWRERLQNDFPHAPARWPPAVPLDADGRPLPDVLHRLLRAQDGRDVAIDE